MNIPKQDEHDASTQPKDIQESGLKQKASWYPGCGPASLIGLVGLACVFYFGIRPMFLEDVDPNLKGPEINRVATDGKQSGPELRNSFTDVLVIPQETPPEHPLDPALEVARKGLERLRNEVRDYTALMVKRERVKGVLLEEEFLRVKVRHAQPENSINRAFYVRHLKPKRMAGQEAIWIENKNNGELIGHGAGIQKFFKVSLDPDNWLAMRGNRYPITELGIETLMVRMIEKGERDRQHDDQCTVEYSRNVQFDGNPCTIITITHPRKMDPFEFHVAKIYIDDKLQLPVGYEGFLWPETEGGDPVLVERYFYRELKINVGLKDRDFDPDNPEYDYP